MQFPVGAQSPMAAFFLVLQHCSILLEQTLLEAVSRNLHLMLSILFLKKTSPKHSGRLARQSIVLLSTVTGGDTALDFGLQGEDKAACLPQWVRSASLSHLTEHLSPIPAGGR